MQENSSNTNTILITIVLIILVGFVVWWFAVRGSEPQTPSQESSELNVDVNLPGGSQPNPSPTPTSPSTGSGSPTPSPTTPSNPY